MDVHCHHHTDSDMENLLLDDENTDKSCLKCRKNQGRNGHVQVDFSSGKLILEDSVCEDLHSEDSPLLINVNVSNDICLLYFLQIFRKIIYIVTVV